MLLSKYVHNTEKFTRTNKSKREEEKENYSEWRELVIFFKTKNERVLGTPQPWSWS
jgi:hypothetical protein